MASLKTITSGDCTRINFKVSSFQINRHNLAMIAWLDLATHLSLINRIATSGELLFAIPELSECHGFAGVSTWPLIYPGRGVYAATDRQTEVGRKYLDILAIEAAAHME